MRGYLGAFEIILAVGTVLAGCSVHPIAQNVTRIPTNQIVAGIRCEMRIGFAKQIAEFIKKHKIARLSSFRDLLDKDTRDRITFAPNDLGPAKNQKLTDLLENYGQSAIAYDFDFEITETNQASSSVAFKLPFTSLTVLDAGAAGSLTKSRVGKRTFKSQHTFTELLNDHDWCDSPEYFGVKSRHLPRSKNLMYPISGSIGLAEVVETFMKLSEQGGGKENFVDALTFMTSIGGSVNAGIKLNPVTDRFRLVSANAELSGGRIDVHKVTVSLAFPLAKSRREHQERLRERSRRILDPEVGTPLWRARYNICVADARSREDKFERLRDSPPEVYCIDYANVFSRLSASEPSSTLERMRRRNGRTKRSRKNQKPLQYFGSRLPGGRQPASPYTTPEHASKAKLVVMSG